MSHMKFISIRHIKRRVSGLAYMGYLLMNLPSTSTLCSAALSLISTRMDFESLEESVAFQQT